MERYLADGGKILPIGAHYPDKYKLPNHITFSDESIYSNELQQGGKWRIENEIWHFKPSDFNLTVYTIDELINYFKEFEPNCILDL